MTYKYVQKLVALERNRQDNSINLIASENYIMKNYSAIDYSILNNKYAEGYPGARYYAGCKYVDKIELDAIDKCKKLFKARYVNVQPHSGSQANQAVYMALCNKGDVIMGLSLKDGGHLTHGTNVNYSGFFYKYIKYKLNKNYYIDYDEIERMIKHFRPKILVAGYSAYSRLINWHVLNRITKSYNVFLLADISHVAGLIAAKVYPSPVGIADVITFTLHKTLRGPRGAVILTNSKSVDTLIKKAVFPGIQGGPFLNTIAKKSICFRLAMLNAFKFYQKNVVRNAKALASFMLGMGFKVISSGTDSHLFLVDLKAFNLTGAEAEKLLEVGCIILNRNSLPGDSKSGIDTTGIRIGTAAITARGFGLYEMYLISKWMRDILVNGINPLFVKTQVIKLCNKFPIDL